MHLAENDVGTLMICAALTALASFLTVMISVIGGATLAYYARPSIRYGAILAILLFPFALGSSVWAYSITQVSTAIGLRGLLVSHGIEMRGFTTLTFTCARVIPLGMFFCATTLQRFTTDIRPYCTVHKLQHRFFLLAAVSRMPKSLVLFLGLFGGATMTAEASLPTFLYRANPGTGPETLNILLSRLFRENYASSGASSLANVAFLGFVISILMIAAAAVGSLMGRFALQASLNRLRTKSAGNALSITMYAVGFISIIVSLGTAFVSAFGLAIPMNSTSVSGGSIIAVISNYKPIAIVGGVAATIITFASIAIAVRLRYGTTDLLSRYESSSLAATVLLLPAFVPMLSVVALLGVATGGRMTGVVGYAALLISHIALHYPIFQLIAATLIAGIPEFHVGWQRSSRMRYSFSLANDGFKRNASVITALVGLGTLLVFSDGAVSRWFSNLVESPEEALYASMFGRVANIHDAIAIAWAVAAVASAICLSLATAFVFDLRGRCR